MSDGPLHSYRALRAEGAIKDDPQQALAIEKLQSLHHALKGYQPASGMGGWKDRLGLGRRKVEPPQGLYLYGPVGRGKSMVMDLFFEHAPVDNKRRVHFHAFMAEVHDRLHAWRQAAKGQKEDPLPEVAAEIAEEAWLLCFDEFVVINIADAMILGRLFETLFKLGVVVVATSNFEPDRLYEKGLQRERFAPFIALLKERLDVHDLGTGTDYRLAHLQEAEVYHTPLDPEAERALKTSFKKLTEGAETAPLTLKVKGRKIPVRAAARGVGLFSFAELCEKPLGAEDYLAIARRFHTVVLEGVPVLTREKRNEARRFMNLIDALYEYRVNLLASAAAPPEELYPEDADGAFEFQRTVSRLIEMRSQDYIDHPHRAGED